MAGKEVLITGNTYPVREQLRALGGRWDPVAKGWHVAADKEAGARTLLASTPVSTPRRKSAWRPCGYPGCSPQYCDECDGEGYKPEWRGRRF